MVLRLYPPAGLMAGRLVIERENRVGAGLATGSVPHFECRHQAAALRAFSRSACISCSARR
jgi:hypothetical protein